MVKDKTGRLLRQDVSLSYIVLVDLVHEFFQLNVFKTKLLASLLKLILGDVPATILIEVGESRMQVIFPLDLVEMQHCRHELPVVYGPTVVYIRL